MNLRNLGKSGLRVSLVDLVSVRQANLYVELLTRLGRSDPLWGPNPPALYAVTLRGRKPPKGRMRFKLMLELELRDVKSGERGGEN